jgi:hypothetical protein
MSYDISWAVVGDRGLSDAEIEAAAQHVAKWSEDIDGYDLVVAKAPQPAVQAFCSRDLSTEELEDELNIERLFDALGELKELLPAFEIRVEDGFNAFEWDGDGFVPKGAPGGLAHPNLDERQWELITQRVKPAARQTNFAKPEPIF